MAVWKQRSKWRAEVYVVGRRIAARSGFEREKDAQNWHDEITVQYRIDPNQFEKKEDPKTFEDLLEMFKKLHLPTIRPLTKIRYLVDIDQRISPFFAHMQLEKISTPLIETFKIELMGKLKPKSVNNCLFTLKLMLGKAVEWRLMKESPYTIKALKIDNSRRLEWWDDKENIRQFLDEARTRSRYYSAYLLALETGMRLGEIVGLSKKDIDFERGRIHVWRQWSDKLKAYGPPKHGFDRWIDFNPQGHLAKMLAEAVEKSNHVEAIFLTRTGSRVGNRKLAADYFKHLIKKSGVPLICFHSLRHTFASWYMVEVDDIWALKNILGHQSIVTTHRYAHHSKRHQRKPLEMAELASDKTGQTILRVVGKA